jgi:hypothetical protein
MYELDWESYRRRLGYFFSTRTPAAAACAAAPGLVDARGLPAMFNPF